MSSQPATSQYAKVIDASKRVRWEIDRDVIRGRRFDYTKSFLPDGLSLASGISFLSASDKRLFSQVQGRSYAYIFGLVERYIGAKVMDISRNHWFGDQVAMEALVRMTDEELKHQELFRRLEEMMEADMPPGYVQTADANGVAQAVLSKSTWSVLALTLDIELFTQAHYRASIEPQADISELWKDVFLFHWREESQHAQLDEMELDLEDARLTAEQRDAAVDDLIALVGAVDGILQAQAQADAHYFVKTSRTKFTDAQLEQIHDKVLKAYRWQYIISGTAEPRFQKVLTRLLDQTQITRIENALAPLTYALPDAPEVPFPMAA
jgi:hypothetical protein